jgi:type VII secretion-associated serine protease mycosin
MAAVKLAGVVLVFLAVLLAPVPAQADRVGNGQWQLNALNAAAAWRFATGAAVTVAVLDSGVDADHPDLRGQVLPGADFVDGSTDGRYDFVGHGTTVAALIAGHDDRTGVVGVAPNARILPVRVLDAQNRYADSTLVADGLRWAVDQGADVVNLSLGGTDPSDALGKAVRYAIAHDVVVVACTGNVHPGEPERVWYPARDNGVIAVAGMTGDSLWSGSITGPQTVLTAPAVDMVGARPGGYWRVEGTSFAAPLVAAAAALVRSRWPELSADNVVNRLIRTAHDLGTPGRDDVYGFGEVDALAALTGPVPKVGRNPLEPATVGLRPAAQLEATTTRTEHDLTPWLGLLGLLLSAGLAARFTGAGSPFRRRRPYSSHRSARFRPPPRPRPHAR